MDNEPQTLVETAGEIMQDQIDGARAEVAAVVEAAVEAVDAANERASEIARAAMETELGRRITALETRDTEWQGLFAELRQALSSQQEEISSLRTQLAATATLTVATAISEPSPSLTPEPSSSPPTTETVEAISEVLPENLSESVVVPPVPAPEPPKKRHRFL